MSVGAVVAAPFEEDECWYRAEVKAVDSVEGTADLLYLDFGDRGTVELALLKKLR